MVRVPPLDLVAQARTLGPSLREAVERVLADQQCILGPHVERFEAAMAAYCRVTHAIGVGSGTDALLLVLASLGVGPGTLVVTTAFTFFATGSTIVRLGARPLFADIDPQTFNLSPVSVAAAIAAAPERVVGIVPVHLYGRLAPLDAIGAVAERHGLWVVEDAAQAVGARRAGRMAGTFARAGCLSFYPTKNLGALGDGGMVLTDDEAIATFVRRDRHQGQVDRYRHESLGLCSRLDAVQAVVLEAKLPHLDAWNARRRAIAAAYDERLRAAGVAGVPDAPIVLPGAAGEDHVVHQYVVRARRRDGLLAHLRDAGVGAQVYYPVPLHLQPPIAPRCVTPVPLDETERAAREVLALPVYPELTPAQIDAVVAAVRSFY
ncbi:MAG TPA: DegT/DnrJ/EryC1/StrS family aminotransferase [Candidatus Eisenbacteria bacterium]|nr:DegT/DnrJ/EryC1/StrS family aminotransferase [Candidatus Eisenbacteria bacterium]